MARLRMPYGVFVLNVFLMSLVLTKKYGFSPSGLKDYAQNRFLRIYPSYIFSVILGIGVLFVLKRYHFETTVLNPAFQRPGSLYEFIGNFLMIPFAVGGLFVPVASALFVEVWAYALMPFMAYSRHAAILGFLITLAGNIQYGITPESFPIRYSGFATGLLPFP